eukprot:1969971-Alexandrium_andersonii.AAC.1
MNALENGKLTSEGRSLTTSWPRPGSPDPTASLFPEISNWANCARQCSESGTAQTHPGGVPETTLAQRLRGTACGGPTM